MNLDLRIAEERMIALTPPFREPDWYWSLIGDGYVPHAFTMDAAGTVPPRWQHIDEVDWTRAVAVRLEDRWGNPIDPTGLDEEMDGWE